jgi:porphobilinogen synthase
VSELLDSLSTKAAGAAGFPQVRLRRLRQTAALRGMVRETVLSPLDFVYPLFVTPGRNVRLPIDPMPGQFQFSVDQLLIEVDEAQSLGVPAVLLFGVPSSKDGLGTEAYDDDGIIQRATRAIKQTMPDMVVITDVCLCEYTDHGHCGILTNEGLVDNDSTLELLAKTAVSQARAGADIVAPSAMMDGQVTALRAGLEAAGMASAYYGPFRIAAESTPKSGDRKSYQMDGANFREALREMEQDALEGADILMVKPALAYLDILSKARQRFDHPMAAYNVSGEYSMLKAAAAAGWLDETAAMMEMLISIKRAGADFIMTYFAKDAARVLRESA